MNTVIPFFTPWLTPEAYLVLMILATVLAEVFWGKRFPQLTLGLTLFAILGAALFNQRMLLHPLSVTWGEYAGYQVDAFALLTKLFVYGMTFLVLLYSRTYITQKLKQRGEFYILLLIAVLGISVLASSASYLTLYLGLELLSLPFYAMVAMQQEERNSAEAAIKYFILGAVASAILLFGISLMVAATGSEVIPGMQQGWHGVITQIAAPNLIAMKVGMAFLLLGAAFKLGAAPFHMWVPDVYEAAPAPVTLLIASIIKVAALALVVRLLVNIDIGTAFITLPLMGIAVLSMAFGNLVAIVQSNIRRMLAYSSVAHMGYMMLGLVAGTNIGFGAAMFYMIVYTLMSLGAFGIIVILSQRGTEIHTIRDLRGLNVRHPWLAFLMLLLMFSMAGIPPTAGFFAKVAVLEALITTHHVWLAALALILAVIGVYYYLNVVKAMYFDAPDEHAKDITLLPMSKSQSLAISVNGLLILVLGLLPAGLFDICREVFNRVQ